MVDSEAARLLGRLKEAAGELRRVVKLAQSTANRSGEAVALHYLATVEADLGPLGSARDNPARSVDLARDMNDNVTIAHALTTLGDVLTADQNTTSSSPAGKLVSWVSP